MTRLGVLTVIAVIVSGCSPAGPSAPTTTATIGPPTPPSVPTLATTLSGTVLATTPSGTFRVSGGQVVFLAGGASGSVTVGSDGHYEIIGLPAGKRVRVTAFPLPGSQLFQRSATSITLAGQTILDIELVAEPEVGTTYGPPTLSGRVYYVAPDGVRPWPHTRVVYKSVEGPWYDVYQASDDDGRFAFGRLPLGPGQLGAGDCNDQLQFQRVVIQADTVSDLDVTPLVTQCPGIPR
jgi:hypothetical protein